MKLLEVAETLFNDCKNLVPFSQSEVVKINSREEGYQVKDYFLEQKEKNEAGNIAGWKVALTNIEMQRLTGINEPAEGAIFEPLIYNDNAKIKLDNNTVVITREIDEGLEKIKLSLPIIATCDLRLNEPRYIKLPDIMKAKKKNLEQISLDDLAVEAAISMTPVTFDPPEQRQKGIFVKNVAELVSVLKDKGLI